MSDRLATEEEILAAHKANSDLGDLKRGKEHLLSDPKSKSILDTYEKAELADKDHLTGLYNRRGFDKQLESMYALSERTGDSLSIAFIDADKFKSINSKYGHAKGDEVLMAIADSMKQSFRLSDILARWGGDEFAAIMLGAKDDEPINPEDLGRRLNERLKDLSPKGVSPTDISVTVGIAKWDGQISLSEFQKQVQYQMSLRKENV